MNCLRRRNLASNFLPNIIRNNHYSKKNVFKNLRSKKNAQNTNPSGSTKKCCFEQKIECLFIYSSEGNDLIRSELLKEFNWFHIVMPSDTLCVYGLLEQIQALVSLYFPKYK